MVATSSLTHYLLLILLALVASSLQSDLSVQPECKIERVSVRVSADVPGCDDAIITVRACNGACFSGEAIIVDPPFSSNNCSSCQPDNYKVKPRRVLFTCDGKQAERRMYLPNVRGCRCFDCLTYVDSSV